MSTERSSRPTPTRWMLAAEEEIQHLARYAARRRLPLSAHLFRTVAEQLGAAARAGNPKPLDGPAQGEPGPG